MTGSTFELDLTRLGYLVGDWDGKGEGQDLTAQARFEWTLNDHFIAGFCEMRDAGSDQVLSIEHVPRTTWWGFSLPAIEQSSNQYGTPHALFNALAAGKRVLTTDKHQKKNEDYFHRRRAP